MENELVDLIFAHFCELRFSYNATCNGFCLDFIGWQAFTIIGNFNDDVAALMIGAEGDVADFRFTSGSD